VRAGVARQAAVAAATARAKREEEPSWSTNANWQAFVQKAWQSWVLTCGELQVARVAVADLNEPLHNDGSMSVLHMSLTLWGRRDVRNMQDAARPEVFAHCVPGTCYVGNMTGPTHQVHHSLAPAHELLQVDGQPCSMTVQFRTALFPHYQSRKRDSTASPKHLFFTLATCFTECLQHGRFRLPTLAECKAEVAEPAN